ncbi:hypothetical protein N2152v2_002549 [Parachlorella kessleri]
MVIVPASAKPLQMLSFIQPAQAQWAAVQTFHCRLRALVVVGGAGSTSAGQWESCSSPMTFTSLQEGRWGMTVLAIDAAGAVNETAESSFWVAFTAPTASISSGPAMGATVTSDSVTFGLAVVASPASAAVARYETMLVSTEVIVSAAAVLGSWVPATGSIGYQDLDDGYYVLELYAIDVAGNIGPVTAAPFQVAAGFAGSGNSVIIGAVVGGGGGLLLTLSS